MLDLFIRRIGKLLSEGGNAHTGCIKAAIGCNGARERLEFGLAAMADFSNLDVLEELQLPMQGALPLGHAFSQDARQAHTNDLHADDPFATLLTHMGYDPVSLDALQARIAELEEQKALLDDHPSQACGNIKKRNDRIAELEAALKPFADCEAARHASIKIGRAHV